jgi:hypothetical protein
MLKPSRILAFFVLLLTVPAANAGGSQDFGDYVVHYNALATDQLPPQVASAYGIVRSKNRALLNVSITRKQDGTIGRPVEALVNVNTSNLSGQLKSTRLRKVTEDGETQAIYYIAEINVSDGETLIFDIRVTPQGHDQTYHVRFRQQFFAN